jgi:hypothetical protein
VQPANTISGNEKKSDVISAETEKHSDREAACGSALSVNKVCASNSSDFRIFKYIEDQMTPLKSDIPGPLGKRSICTDSSQFGRVNSSDCLIASENSNFSQSLGTQDTEETSREKSDEDDLGTFAHSNLSPRFQLLGKGGKVEKNSNVNRVSGPNKLEVVSESVYIQEPNVVVPKSGDFVRPLSKKKRITPTFIASIQDKSNFLSTKSAFS